MNIKAHCAHPLWYISLWELLHFSITHFWAGSDPPSPPCSSTLRGKALLNLWERFSGLIDSLLFHSAVNSTSFNTPQLGYALHNPHCLYWHSCISYCAAYPCLYVPQPGMNAAEFPPALLGLDCCLNDTFDTYLLPPVQHISASTLCFSFPICAPPPPFVSSTLAHSTPHLAPLYAR